MEPKAEWPRGKRMPKKKRAIPVAVSLGIVGAFTSVLFYLKLASMGLHHPIFVYLPLIALVAMVYGSVAALIGASAAIACAAFFLYDPAYSFAVAKALEVGDLFWFALLAVIVTKCARALRPASKLPEAKSRYGWS
jgi:K+-sensing histidine kinase KdpD